MGWVGLSIRRGDGVLGGKRKLVKEYFVTFIATETFLVYCISPKKKKKKKKYVNKKRGSMQTTIPLKARMFVFLTKKSPSVLGSKYCKMKKTSQANMHHECAHPSQGCPFPPKLF